MKLLLTFNLFLLLFSNVENNTNNTLFFNIDFQQGFQNDTLSLMINNTEIFENEVATTFNMIGLTLINNIKVYSDSKKTFVEYKNQKILLKTKAKKDFKFEITINNKKFIFFINQTNGQYIGFNKSDNKINYIQTDKTFYYY